MFSKHLQILESSSAGSEYEIWACWSQCPLAVLAYVTSMGVWKVESVDRHLPLERSTEQSGREAPISCPYRNQVCLETQTLANLTALCGN